MTTENSESTEKEIKDVNGCPVLFSSGFSVISVVEYEEASPRSRERG